jgi:hypothetical protein
MALEAGIAGRLSERLLDLAGQVRRLDPPGRIDLERFWIPKSELAGQIGALAEQARAAGVRHLATPNPRKFINMGETFSCPERRAVLGCP